VMTLAGTLSLRHFLNNLQDNIFSPNSVATLLICLIIIPLVPLAVPYFFLFPLLSISPWIYHPELAWDPMP
jgi:hypothetical protein